MVRCLLIDDKVCKINYLLQGTPVNIIVGSHVWVEDPDVAWVDGLVLKVSGKEAEIQTSNGNKVY